MAQFSPKFCSIHLKIHVCENQDITKKVSEIEGDLGAKVRRLHGTQTEEELQLEAKKQEKFKNAPGSLGDILAKAKAKVAAEKAKFEKESNKKEDEGNVVTEAEIGDRMAALRAKMTGDTLSTSTLSIDKDLSIHNPPNSNSKGNNKTKNGNLESNKKKTNKTDDSASKQAKNTKKFDDFFEVNNDKSDEIEVIDENDLEDKDSIKDKLFTYEETHELIQSAVEKALEQVGFLDKNKTKKNNSSKK
ncbi:hypothetical protein [Spiroplasma tabanidicola]|uniref:Uncharacterized protein n=1 Tax=Spiroplasma tabanidicola TaxID=324079 RepID=A0A6I6CCT5_9MOLU|nr:hypothetical protein [Spiroplasma tabanidicola]QGS51952.1 hypothetical protein STABA_v1c05890 [Spiroplasma tabanidicola]